MNQLKYFRELNQLTQKQVAKAIGVSEPTYIHPHGEKPQKLNRTDDR